MKPSTLCLAIALVLPTLATAQTTKSSSPKTVDLGPITVNARFIPESSFDLPFTVNRISDTTLDNTHDNNLEALMQQTAGVEVHSFGNPQSTIKIRGMGMLSNESASSDDNSVVIYQNGAPQANNRLSQPLFDMQQVDILKGPQGTLYGRNSAAGVINLIPNPPSTEREGSIDLKLGTRNFKQATAVLNLPITEQLSTRIAASAQKQNHALNNKQNGGKPLSHPSSGAVRLGIGYHPSQDDDILLTTEYSKQNQQIAGFTVLDGKPITDIDGRKLVGNHESSNATLNWHHRWNNLQLTSTTNILKDKYQTGGPAYDDRIHRALFNRTFNSNRVMGNNERHFFQEFRIGSTEDAPVFWTAGINYLHSRRHFNFNFLENEEIDAAGSPMNALINRHYKTQSTGIFGEATYPLTERLALTTGLRFNWDKLNYRADWQAKPSYLMPGARTHRNAQSLHEHYLTGRVGMTFKLNDAWKVYGIYAHGHKSGSFGEFSNSIAYGMPDVPYRAANTNSYEIGTKWRSADNRLETSAALFYNHTRNEHLYVFAPPTFISSIENFNTQSKGAELELNWRPNDSFKLGGNLAYTDARITKVPKNTASSAKKGYRIPDTPRWSAGISADYYQPFTLFCRSSMFNAHLDYHYTGERAETVSNKFNLKPVNMLNARVGVSTENSDIYLWGSNLLNNRSPIYGYQIDPIPASYGGTNRAVRTGSLREGRIIGIDYRYQF